MKRKLILALVATGVLATSAVALAQPHGFEGPRVMARLFERLNLSDQQEELALDVRDEVRAAAKAQKKEALASMDSVVSELEKQKPNGAQLHAIADQRIEGFKKVVHLGIDKFLQLHATLSGDQRHELTESLKTFSRRAKRWE